MKSYPGITGTDARPQSVELKKTSVAYLLAIFLGLLGAHHFYLGRPKFGRLYLCTGGLFGVGYVVDLIRVPWLVENANLEVRHPERRGTKYLGDAYLLWFPPFGLLGFHHFYLGHYYTGFCYMLTMGALGICWLLDAILLPVLWIHWVNELNGHCPEKERSGKHLTENLTEAGLSSLTSSAVMTSPPPPYTSLLESCADAINPPSYEQVMLTDAAEKNEGLSIQIDK
ncbi:uncharacterized protein [Haliotis cracherodii]|uniref:uncharacterized protein n=1 Tax=Haliotis cracherodii TaxID=6455 RepID=UPI0039E72F1C